LFASAAFQNQGVFQRNPNFRLTLSKKFLAEPAPMANRKATFAKKLDLTPSLSYEERENYRPSSRNSCARICRTRMRTT
jgi:hypothetical protein